MHKKRTSIIIPTLNKNSRLNLVLKSLESQVTEETEVIIVFDGCDKDVIEEFNRLTYSFQPVSIICEVNVGRSAARNIGLKRACGDIIIFLDDDRIVSPDYIKSHLEAHDLAGEPAVVLGARKEIYLSEEEIRTVGTSFADIIEKCEKHGEAQDYPFKKKKNALFRWMNFFTGNVSIDKELIDNVGGFDENFVTWGGEDNDLGIQLFLEKVNFYYNYDAINYHMMHPSNFTNQLEQVLLNLKYMMKKYRFHLFVEIGLLVFYYSMKLNGLPMSECQKERYESDL